MILHQPHPWHIVLLASVVAGVPLLPWSRADKTAAVALVLAGGALELSSRMVGTAADALPPEVASTRGIVVSTPRVSERYVTADIALLDERGGTTGLLLRTHVPDTTILLRRCDTLDVIGRARKIPPPANPGETDWSRLLRQRGIIGRLWAQRIAVRPASRRLSPRHAARAHIESTLVSHARGQQGALALAMLIGIREMLDQETMASFRDAGIVHVLSISGFHVGIVAALLYCVAGLLLPGYRFPAVASLIGVATYVMLVGGHPPVLRAGIMCVIVLLGLTFGRRAEGINSLGVAGLILVAAQPRWIWEPGFQLSFGATLGILVFTPPMLRLLRGWSRAARWCAGSMLTSLSAQLGVLPLLLFWFRQWPTYSLLANIPAVLLATVLIGAALITAAAQIVWTDLASIGGRVTGTTAGILLWVADRVADLPSSVLPFGDPFLWILTAAWGAALGWRVGRLWGRPLMPAMAGAGCVACAWLGWAMSPWETPAERVSFLHVPGGNCIVVEDSNARALLDIGAFGRPEYAARTALDHLRFRRGSRVALVGATSSRAARFGAVDTLRLDLEPERLMVPSRAELRPHSVAPIRWSESPDASMGRHFTLQALGAGPTALDGLVIRSAGGLKVLIAGDGGWRSDAQCATWAAVESTDVLYIGPSRDMAPSHLLVRRARPRLIVLGGASGGEEDLWRDLTRQGHRVAMTSRGAVTVECAGDEVRWRQHRSP